MDMIRGVLVRLYFQSIPPVSLAPLPIPLPGAVRPCSSRSVSGGQRSELICRRTTAKSRNDVSSRIMRSNDFPWETNDDPS